jgi:hypothetical protein
MMRDPKRTSHYLQRESALTILLTATRLWESRALIARSRNRLAMPAPGAARRS